MALGRFETIFETRFKFPSIFISTRKRFSKHLLVKAADLENEFEYGTV